MSSRICAARAVARALRRRDRGDHLMQGVTAVTLPSPMCGGAARGGSRRLVTVAKPESDD